MARKKPLRLPATRFGGRYRRCAGHQIGKPAFGGNLPLAEIGYWLSRHHSGVMTGAVNALCVMAARVGYEALLGLVREGNDRSANVLKRAGFDGSDPFVNKTGRTYARFVRRFV